MSRFIMSLAVCASMLLAGCSKNGGGDDQKTYTITVLSDGNGTVGADKATAAEGETVELEATPAPGYSFDKWTVESGGVTCSPDASANPATFTMPAADVKIKAQFVLSGVLINGTIWAFCNVDAPGKFAAKPEDTGMFYQWNRKVGCSTTDPLTNSQGGTTWNTTNEVGDEWAADNDPCPAGWRVPTNDELIDLCDTEKTSSEWEPLNGANGRRIIDNDSKNYIFFPITGYRNSDGTLAAPGLGGYYWSASKASGSEGYYMRHGSGGAYPEKIATRAFGFAVRCVAK